MMVQRSPKSFSRYKILMNLVRTRQYHVEDMFGWTKQQLSRFTNNRETARDVMVDICCTILFYEWNKLPVKNPVTQKC